VDADGWVRMVVHGTDAVFNYRAWDELEACRSAMRCGADFHLVTNGPFSEHDPKWANVVARGPGSFPELVLTKYLGQASCANRL
jgi:hypothetical protein